MQEVVDTFIQEVRKEFSYVLFFVGNENFPSSQLLGRFANAQIDF